ncbi:MAG: CHAT domain-containing protein, partial [Cyanobacteria bacterium P01_G01_bin.49]
MAVITVCETGKTETGFDATLIIEGNSYAIAVSEPFDTKQEQELEWYFENWMDYPMLDNIKADRAKDSVREYGEELFWQVFQSNSEAYRKYSDLKQNLSQLTIEIVSINPEFQAIHWEALRDPESTHPLAIDTILIRKSIQPKKAEVKIKKSPTINLLVVVARPKADRDIGHRTISRPLVETIRNAKLRVNIEILRPGTYEALVKHLEAKGNGYYHIVHFDVHGSLQNYETYQERLEIGMYLESRYGREEIKEYDGFKAFLALEGEEIGEYDPVEASEIANLLTSKDIPVCILNACQSGKQLNQAEIEDNRETSLGNRFLNAGMQMVVAMSYSVTVTAAEIMMQQLYEHLFDQRDINQAILLGRKELYNCKARKAAYNTEIDLEDWLLPVIYSNGEVTFNLREFTPEETVEYDLNLASKYKFVEPNYGFVGRDIDILLIDKALLQHNILLLQGMGGTGKTTLLNYLREWWEVTKFAEDTFYFAYDKRAYNLQQIIFEISKQLYNQFYFERFQSKNISEQCQEISIKLRNNSYILILDNLESITGQSLAIKVLLSNLKDKSPKEVLERLEKVEIEPGGDDKENNIIKCIE